MQSSRLRQCAALIAVLFFLTMMAAPLAFARGSFGGGGRGFGGSFGGGRGFGGFGGGSRPSFTPPPRPAFAPAPRPVFTPAPPPMPMSRPTFTPAPSPAAISRPTLAPAPAPALASPPGPAPGSFGRAGGVGNAVSHQFTGTTGGGGSFGKTGAAGNRTFTSLGSHPHAAPAPSPNLGRPYVPAFAHSYSYGGRPANAYFTGGYRDYSFGHYGHPYYAWMPWSPIFYYNPPLYMGGQYVSGGFSLLHLLLGLVFWGIVIALVVAIFRSVSHRSQF